MTRFTRPLLGGSLAALMLLSACGGANGTTSTSAGPSAAGGSPPAATDATASKASDLRTKLDLLLEEHLILATKATAAALGGRNQEFAAYGKALNDNGTAIGDFVGAAYGTDAATNFNRIWSAHNGFFVDYTKAVATQDPVAKQAAVTNLTSKYVPEFAALISGATGLPLGAVTQLTTMHVQMTAGIVDAQAAKRWTTAYADIRMAYAHMQKIGDAIAEAIAAKDPAHFPGDPTSKAVGLRVALNTLFQEHIYLATDATDAALGGRSDEFAAAGEALNQNGTDLGAAVGGIYGAPAGTQFNQLWSAHNGFFVDYTKAVATSDANAKQKAVDSLTNQYVKPFATFLAGATGAADAALSSLLADHVNTTAAVVDAEFGALSSMDYTATVAADLVAAHHMEMIADPLASAIVAKLPASFS